MIFLPYISKKFIKGHDYICHYANIYSIDKNISLKDLVLYPSKIRPLIANNMGYGNGIFYPQMSYYCVTCIYLIIKQLGMSIITSIKIYEFIIVFLSGIFMYKFVNKTFNNKDAGLLSAIIYMCSPYFISDVFIRMSIAEFPIFLFMPIIMISIDYIIKHEYNKFFIYFIIGYVGMILSHLVMTVYFTIILAIILLFNIKQLLNKKTIITFSLATIVVIGITAPFTFPLLEHKIKGDYVVFQDNTVVNIKKLTDNKLDFYEYISINKKHSFVTYTSMITIILIGIVILNKDKILKNKYEKNIMYSMIIMALLSFIISSKVIKWNEIPKIFWLIQFPWRLCSLIALSTSVIAGIGIRYFNVDTKKLILILTVVVCFSDINSIMQAKWKLGTTTENRHATAISNLSSAMGYQMEYLPAKTKTNIDYLKNRDDNNILIKKGQAEICNVKNRVPYLEFDIDVKNETTILEIPRIFYFGYDIKLIDNDGKVQKIDYYENDNGFIEFEIFKSGKIKIDYKGTIINKVSNIISILLIITLILYFTLKEKLKDIGKEKIKTNAKA